LLTVLIEEYEAKHDPVPEAEPGAIIRHSMEAHNLRQKDPLDVLGTESIASEVLRGKRELTKQHIRRLSKKFNVSPAVFFYRPMHRPLKRDSIRGNVTARLKSCPSQNLATKKATTFAVAFCLSV
jgi:plasmid maintenance system antidote protein VapI